MKASEKAALFPCLVAGALVPVFAMEGTASEPSGTGISLVLRLAVAVLVAILAGAFVKRLGWPGILGNIIAGAALGPYALGALSLPGLPSGLFPLSADPSTPLGPELHLIMGVSAAFMLFATGFGADLSYLRARRFSGLFIGSGGALAAFAAGAFACSGIIGAGILDPRCLFMGAVAAASSMSVIKRMLAARRRLHGAEAGTIFAASTLDDIVGMALLAVAAGAASGVRDAAHPIILARSLAAWLAMSGFGVFAGSRIARLIARRHPAGLALMAAVGVPFVYAGVLDPGGVWPLIGSYVIGLSLSASSLRDVVRKSTESPANLFTAVFFALAGMLFDWRLLIGIGPLLAALAFAGMVLGSKYAVGGLLALATGFNLKGASRIAGGLFPRGEVALIVAGLGMSLGVLDGRLFGVAAVMTVASVLLAPLVVGLGFSMEGSGTRSAVKEATIRRFDMTFGSADTARLAYDSLSRQFLMDGCSVRAEGGEEGLSLVGRGGSSFSFELSGPALSLHADPDAMGFVRTAVLEAVASLDAELGELKEAFAPAGLEGIFGSETAGTERPGSLRPSCVAMDLRGDTKEAVIKELLSLLDDEGFVADGAMAESDVLDRERSMGTGMRDGIAIPHAKTGGVAETAFAIGVKRDGVDFGAPDGKSASIIVLLLSPKDNPASHLRNISDIASALSDEITRGHILSAQSREEILTILGA